MRLQFLIGLILVSSGLFAQLRVNTSRSAEYLVKEVLVGGDAQSAVEIQSVTYTGNPEQIGEFYTGATHIDIREGIILSTGYAKSAIGPNTHGGVGSRLHGKGDVELIRIANNITMDAAILQFTFVPKLDRLAFDFVFASEEYPEYIRQGVNDVFAFILINQTTGKRQNLAVVPGTTDPVTIDHVNQFTNSEYFIMNGRWQKDNILKWRDNLELGEYAYTFQYDGFTTWLQAKAQVNPGELYALKIAIADAGDGVYDSAVLLKKNSFKAERSELSQLEQETDELKRYFDAERVKTRGDSLVLTLNLNFESNKASTTSEKDLDNLNEVVQIMKRNPKLFLKIEGFTDSQGKPSYNLDLSQKRADFSKTFVVDKGIDLSRIQAQGFGMNNPLASNQTEEGRAKNRRVEFVFFLK